MFAVGKPEASFYQLALDSLSSHGFSNSEIGMVRPLFLYLPALLSLFLSPSRFPRSQLASVDTADPFFLSSTDWRRRNAGYRRCDRRSWSSSIPREDGEVPTRRRERREVVVAAGLGGRKLCGGGGGDPE
jgi:hypothetical protein